MVAGPELSRLVNKFEITSGLSQTTPADNKHHEDSFSMQRDFFENFKSLVKTFNELGNPFLEESSDLYKLDTKEVADPESANIENLLSTGLKQYESFLERLTNEGQTDLNIYDVIKENNFPLFNRKQKPGPSSADAKLKNLKGD